MWQEREPFQGRRQGGREMHLARLSSEGLTMSLSGRLQDWIARHARTINPARMAPFIEGHGRSKRWLDRMSHHLPLLNFMITAGLRGGVGRSSGGVIGGWSFSHQQNLVTVIRSPSALELESRSSLTFSDGSRA